MSPNKMLRALDYTTSPTGIAEFQRDFNRLGTDRTLLVSGELDDATVRALGLAYEARAVFDGVRERRRRDA